ncbi:MAG TPA: HD domain-containing phosphohydrolase [Nitrospirota bacterium]|nr:HD domain-containing phosphohydrolase [Nitrospirota bacterium]
MYRSRILIIDDDPLVRDVLSDIFSQSGSYQPEIACDGHEGLKKIRESDFDMVFTDLTMPGINGIDFMKTAFKINPTLAVVVITGHSSIENATNAMREGAKDFITKPFSVSTVTSTADRLIGERRLLKKTDIGDPRNSLIGRLNSELFKRLQEVRVLQSISTELDSLYRNEEIFQKVVDMVSRLLMVKEVSFGIIESGTFKARAAVGVRMQDIPIAGSLFEYIVSTGKHYLSTFGEISPHTGEPLTTQFFAMPFTINNKVYGIINLANKVDGTAFTDDEISLALTFAKRAAQRIENNALYEVFYNNLINTLKSLVNSIEARDSYTKQHSERVTAYALRIAEAMDLPAEDRDALGFGGYLHDIGKIGVRDTILLKTERLTPQERNEINLHPVIGENIVKPLRFFPKVREIILHHHEHFNGSGYPNGLAGTTIPVTARILAVADAYDAMTSSRPYRQARVHEHAAAELMRNANTQFDGEIVRAFLH